MSLPASTTAATPPASLGSPSRQRAQALLEQLPPAQLWRANGLGTRRIATVPTGHAALDAVLPGCGWPLGSLTELLLQRPGVGELRLLLPALRKLAEGRKPIVFIAPPLVPNAAALQALGLPAERLVSIHPGHLPDLLWAAEQCLRSPALAAVLAWLPLRAGQAVRFEALRRLQLAAQSAAGPCFLFRHQAAAASASPAPLRITLEAVAPNRLQLRRLKPLLPGCAESLLLGLSPAYGPLQTDVAAATDMPVLLGHSHDLGQPLPAIARP